MNELNERSILDLESKPATAENELDRINAVYPDSYASTVIGQHIETLDDEIAARGEIG